MNKHTPGPWVFYRRNPKDRGLRDMEFHIGNDSLQHSIAEAHQEANARLIAVAPELYAFAEREAQMPCRCCAPHAECISCSARKLIAKAIG